MTAPRHRLRPVLESLDDRIALSATVTGAALGPPAQRVPGSFPSADAHRPFTASDLQAYASAYLSYQGAADFTPQYDFNGTGFIGQNDATPILRGLAGITPRSPLTLTLKLGPGEQVAGHHPADSGGVTRLGVVTVLGHTTPNSIVFIDGPTSSPHSGPTGNYKFEGGALATDAHGNFSYTIKLADLSRGGSLTAPVFLIRTPFNQQLIRAFPILRIR